MKMIVVHEMCLFRKIIWEDFGEKVFWKFSHLFLWQPVSQHPYCWFTGYKTPLGVNPSHYQNTIIYIQYLPSRLLLCLQLHFQIKFSKSGFKQKIKKLNTSKYLRKVLLGFDDVIKNHHQKDYSKSFILSWYH